MSSKSVTAPRDAFIAAMRDVAASVTVVTTDGPAGRHGATVTAFSSVSADPPTVLVCLHADSRIARAVLQNGRFCVNVLADDSPGIADRFAGRNDAAVSDRFAGIGHCAPSGAPPRIEGATVFECRLDHHVRAASHLVIFGAVSGVHGAALDPLTYRAGTYHRVVPHSDPTSQDTTQPARVS